MITITRALRTAGLVAAMWLAAAPAAAQNVCIPNAVGVPFLSGPPNWFDGALMPPQFWPAVDDPRWRGSYLYTFGGAAASEHVAFRAVRNANSLFLAWHITVDPQLDEVDEIWVGFSPGPGEDDVLLQVTPFTNSGTDVPAMAGGDLPPPAAVQMLTRAPGAMFMPAAGPPSWLQAATTDTRVLRDAGDGRWAILMRVPIAAPPNGLNLANTFRMWFAAMVTHPGGIAEYDYPTALDLTTVLGSTNDTGWQDVRRDVAPTDMSCIRGITLVSSDIGTENGGTLCTSPAGALSSSINLTEGGALATNVMCARPENGVGAPVVAAGDVGATFRIANWGVQPMDPAAIDTVWTPINATPETNSAAIAPGTKGSITFDWTMTANDGTVSDVCTFEDTPAGIVCGPPPPEPRWNHQCILVELSGAPGITFPVSSVARNMNFVEASTFREEAEVSVRGLPPLPGSPSMRDVYLYVQVNNMPAQVAPGTGGRPGGGVTQPGGDPRGVVALVAAPGAQGGNVQPLPKTPYEQLRETEPTYQVHGFYDTGRTYTRAGQTYKILRPQSSFGYFVSHQGELLGWRYELQGPQEIAPDYYRIAVQQGAATVVTTVIEAIESHWSLGLRAGVGLPRDTFDTVVDPGFGFAADLEYAMTSVLAIGGEFGFNRFAAATPGLDDVDMFRIVGRARVYAGAAAVRPFAEAGIGLYRFIDPGTSERGVHVGGGLLGQVTPRVGLEGVYKYHRVDTSPDTTTFHTLEGGLRIRF